MQLLVSVRNSNEARAALEGGAQIVDAKEPSAGSLGRVTPNGLAQIRRAVPGQIPLSAALGDVRQEGDVDRAFEGIEVSLAFVKLGFIGVPESRLIESLLRRAVKLAGSLPGSPRVIAVGYADWRATGSTNPAEFPSIVQTSGAHGLLIDTSLKSGARLFDLIERDRLTRVGAALRRDTLLFAIAGSLEAEDIPTALEVDPDVLGVRGAATRGGRTDAIDSARVALLVRQLRLSLFS